ncbi:tail assembly chaperone [Cytobacillus kochii]|uniref:tail assembly chaperone n=1 Tax=Cytobacillus kochii TaxID=859143 RepID=UPI003F7E2CCC
MEFKIADKEYQLKFGIKFIRELDKIYKVDYQGMEFGMGVNLAFMALNQYNPSVLSQVVHAAVSHSPSAPSLSTIDSAIEDYAEEQDGLESLFEAVLSEMGKSKVTKSTLEKFKKMAQTDTEQPQ